jgi:hypothetical protein
MRFVETPVFTDLVRGTFDEDKYRRLQLTLLLRPEQGSVIPGSGGPRNIRWGAEGRGKRGGVRVIYHWEKSNTTCCMLFLYRKNEQAT